MRLPTPEQSAIHHTENRQIMKDQQTTLTQDIEQLIKKASEANTVIISETAKFLQQLGSSKLNGEGLASMQKQLFSDAVNLFVKLNIQHTANLIDMGVAISKQLNRNMESRSGAATPPAPTAEPGKPAFELNANCEAGKTAAVEFLLNSDKQEPVVCQLKQSAFDLESDPAVQVECEVSFAPQSFELLFGKPQRVEMKVAVPAGTEPGQYRSHIHVDGFEHTFFDLLLTVSAPLPKTVARKAAKPKSTAAKKASGTGKKTPRKKPTP